MCIDYQAVGKRIRQFRHMKRITQEELAFRINTSAAYISNIESGKKKPSLQKLTEIADVFGITINDLLYAPSFNFSSIDVSDINQMISHIPPEKQQILFQSISAILQTIIT